MKKKYLYLSLFLSIILCSVLILAVIPTLTFAPTTDTSGISKSTNWIYTAINVTDTSYINWSKIELFNSVGTLVNSSIFRYGSNFLNTFNDTSLNKSINLNQTANHTFYLSMNKNSVVANASLNFTSQYTISSKTGSCTNPTENILTELYSDPPKTYSFNTNDVWINKSGNAQVIFHTCIVWNAGNPTLTHTFYINGVQIDSFVDNTLPVWNGGSFTCRNYRTVTFPASILKNKYEGSNQLTYTTAATNADNSIWFFKCAGEDRSNGFLGDAFDLVDQPVTWQGGTALQNFSFYLNNSKVYNTTGATSFVNFKTPDFSTQLNTYLSVCTADINGNCTVPLKFETLSGAQFNITNIDINFSSSQNLTNVKNFTSLANGIYYFNATIQNLSGSFTSTETRNVTLDTTGPVITIISPLAQTYGINNISINYTSIDALSPVNTCWYYLNYTNGTPVNGITILPSCLSVYYILSDETYILTIVSNDSLNNIGNKSVTFQTSSTKPAIVLNYPSDNFFTSNTNIAFNFTPFFSLGISTCKLYTNRTGIWSVDYTWVNPTNNTMNGTILSVVNNSYYNWNVWCNSTTGTEGYALNNRTFSVDTISPNYTVSLTTTAGSQFISFNTTVNDSSPVFCRYSIYNLAGGIDAGSANISYNCAQVQSVAVSSYASYTLYLYVNDSAGNWANSSTAFTVSASSGGTVTGGGSSGTTVVTATPVNWQMTAEGGTKSYELKMTKGSSRTKSLLFSNKDNTLRKITLRCEFVSGTLDLCDSIYLEDPFSLPVLKDAFTISDMDIVVSDTMASGLYTVNIIAKDDLGNEDLITVKATIGAFGIVSDTFVKLSSSKDIGGLKVPYVLLFFGMILIFGFGSYSVTKNKSYGAGLSLVLSIFISFFILTMI